MEQLFGAIPAVLSGFGSNEGITKAVVFATWQRCAGEAINARTAPVVFFENRLVVTVADETWQRHLEDLSPQLLVRLNGSLGQGTVKYIEFRIDKKKVNAERRSNAHAKALEDRPIKVSPSLAAAAETIADINLRKQFLSAADIYLARQEGNDGRSQI